MTKPNKVQVVLPYPAKELHPNGGNRHHHGKIARLKREARETAYTLARQMMGRETGYPWTKVMIDAHWYHPQKRLAEHDDDNLTGWLKNYRDGCASAGIVEDDKDMLMGIHYQDKDMDCPRVLLEIREVAI